MIEDCLTSLKEACLKILFNENHLKSLETPKTPMSADSKDGILSPNFDFFPQFFQDDNNVTESSDLVLLKINEQIHLEIVKFRDILSNPGYIKSVSFAIILATI